MRSVGSKFTIRYFFAEGDEWRQYLIGMNFLWWRCDVEKFDRGTFINGMAFDGLVQNVLLIIYEKTVFWSVALVLGNDSIFRKMMIR